MSPFRDVRGFVTVQYLNRAGFVAGRPMREETPRAHGLFVNTNTHHPRGSRRLCRTLHGYFAHTALPPFLGQTQGPRYNTQDPAS